MNVTRIALGHVLGISQRRLLRLIELGVFTPEPSRESSENPAEISCESLLNGYTRIHADDTHLDRYHVAKQLGISPNRVSELVKMGVLEPYSTNPLLFGLDHCRACYKEGIWLKRQFCEYVVEELRVPV